MRRRSLFTVSGKAAVVFLILASMVVLVQAQSEWNYTSGDADGKRYSTLTQINRTNVKELQVAWTFNTGGLDPKVNTAIQCTPIIFEGVMYLTGPDRQVFALDPATGKELWRFNADNYKSRGLRTRGVAFWSDGKKNGARRILFAIPEGQLYSLDAKTGKLDPQFGKNGVLELREGIERDVSKLTYGVSAVPAVFENLVILGFSVNEGYDSAPGDIRAFDVRTGKQAWRFHTVPRPGEFGHDTWKGDSWINRGGTNAWGGVRVDAKNKLVFAGLGSATHDFYGGDRHGDNLFANCVIALDARTGQRKWHFQIVRHDLWDYDVPAPPVLVTVTHNGKKIDAVAQVSKTGYVFLLDRKTGKSLFDIIEKEVPQTNVPGEQTAAKQIFPVKPPPLVRVEFNDNEITNVSPESREYIKEKLKELRYGSIYTPPSVKGSIVMPGLHGGGTWSSAAFDPTTGLFYVNVNDMPWTVFVKPDAKIPGRYNGDQITIFKDQFGLPGAKPPWAYLVAVDLNKGDIKWKVPFGNWPGAEKFGLTTSGTENFGGATVTAGGVVFIGSAMDEKFRAFDKDTGEMLWEHKLPFAAYAAPATYAVNGRQYVIIAAGGGGKANSPRGDVYVTFALPQSQSRSH